MLFRSLLAVLEKRGGFPLGTQDVFLNIAGGLRVEDPAIDLAVAVSIISSFNELPVPGKICFSGEIGLGGEIRAVNRAQHRIGEAEKLGFTKIYLSKYALKGITKESDIEVVGFGRLEDLFGDLWG